MKLHTQNPNTPSFFDKISKCFDCFKQPEIEEDSVYKAPSEQQQEKVSSVIEISKKNYYYQIQMRPQYILPSRQWMDKKIQTNTTEGVKTYFVSVRYGCIDFIERMRLTYEVGIFTASDQDYADEILKHIDPYNLIKRRYYRQHCISNQGKRVKDLSRLGYHLSQVILIDNCKDSFGLQPENGLIISSYYGKKRDRALQKLVPILERLSFVIVIKIFEYTDVRPVSRRVQQIKASETPKSQLLTPIREREFSRSNKSRVKAASPNFSCLDSTLKEINIEIQSDKTKVDKISSGFMSAKIRKKQLITKFNS